MLCTQEWTPTNNYAVLDWIYADDHTLSSVRNAVTVPHACRPQLHAIPGEACCCLAVGWQCGLIWPHICALLHF